MKAGVRALGVAESFRAETSVMAGAVVTGARVADGFSFATCTVGGLDATEAVFTLFDSLDREDVQYLLLSGIAPAWYNLLDLRAIHDHVDRPVISVSFEESDGLREPLRDTFEGEALSERLAIYEAQPARERITVNEETVFVRSIGLTDEDPATVVRAFTPVGGRPEPIRVARLAARGVDALRSREADSDGPTRRNRPADPTQQTPQDDLDGPTRRTPPDDSDGPTQQTPSDDPEPRN